MIGHLLKIAWRNLLKNKLLFGINITGLAIGLAACFMILLYVADELSYDRYNEKADRIVRVTLKGMVGGEEIKEAVTPAPVAPTLLREFPEVEEATRLRRLGRPKISVANQVFRDCEFAYVDSNFFQVFTLPLIKGDPHTALMNPNSVIITAKMAARFYGSDDAMGKVLEIDNREKPYVVTGIMEEVPKNSHFHFDIFASMTGLEDAQESSWMASSYNNYCVLPAGYDFRKLESKLPMIVEKYMGPQVKQALGISYKEFQEKGNQVGLFLQPLTDIHLHSDFSSATVLEPGGNINTVYIFSTIVLFILLIACINFINLSTANAAGRAREVAVHKVLGSDRNQLILQFLTESFLAVMMAVLLAIIMLYLSLPAFNELSGKSIEVGFFIHPIVLIGLLFFGLFVSLLAGTYPAFVLSSFKPVDGLKNKFSTGGDGRYFRSSLIIFQFVIAVTLILATVVVSQQMSFIQNKEIGYDRDHLIVLRNSFLLGPNEQVFKERLLSDPRVLNITSSGFIPAGPTNNSMSGVYPGENGGDFRRTVVYSVDDQYIPTLQMKLAQGRNFSKDYGAEQDNVIINETTASLFGFGENALGQTLLRSMDNEGGRERLTVIGVIRDFHFRSLHQLIEPMIMLQRKSGGLIIRANTGEMKGLLASMEDMWDRFNTGEPFTFGLLDELYNETYISDQNTGRIIRIFTGLIIFIACLGLYGLVTFITERRIKEIGVRKVLGAGTVQLVTLLSSNFLKLVFFSFIIAFPLGYWCMHRWLQDFAYRVNLDWWIFVLAGFFALLISFMTISFKTIQAARRDPVQSLRSE